MNFFISVATGARFKKHGRVLYLELQQGPLEGPSGIEPLFLKWTVSNNCNSSKKIVYDRQEETYDITELKLGDMLLPDDAVVTGILFIYHNLVNNYCILVIRVFNN